MSTKTEKTVEEKKTRSKKQSADQEKELTQQRENDKSTDKATRKEQKKKQKQEKRMNKKPRRRIFPIWARLIVVIVLCATALGVGLMIGYGVIGDGTPRDALEWETWQHIIDIVIKKE